MCYVISSVTDASLLTQVIAFTQLDVIGMVAREK
jgi:hypothetical protein